ncbi:MAG TPA: DUF4192 domain-containing protein [Actinocrinis sp.]|uniref:DUF4192 domain-containing protein n=1 Tax=Actinocrinis sp. TaxID=1920516 RepID=UPI002D5F1C64|nr:DUF4192 domain-containing protein [Actinocrinis sp.]HZU57719.1 DUF4192 domain-containing protein [Actinocrinis sp.]
MSMTTATAAGGVCCGGRECPESDCAGAQIMEPQADRFNGIHLTAGSEDEAEALAAQLEGGLPGAVRLGSPAEVAAAIPHFFGFHPDSSIVMLGLARSQHDCRAGISHGLRVDLSSVAHGPAAFGRWAAGRLVEAGANETLCVIYPPEGGPARMADYRRLVAGMCTPLRLAGVPPLDVLFVADGRWWSFLCDSPTCCPPDGSPVESGASAIAALSAYSGLAVLPNRAALAASLEPYGGEMVERMRAACDDALSRIAAAHFAAESAGDSAFRPEAAFRSGAACFPDGGLGDDTGIPFYPALEPALVIGASTPQGAVDCESESEECAARECVTPEEESEGIFCDATDTPLDASTCDEAIAAPEPPAPEASQRRRTPTPSRILDFDWDDVTRAWQLADSLCDGQVPPDRAMTDETAGALLVALTDVRVRDYLATWCGDDRAGQAVALSVELARRAVTAEQAAAAYSIAAWAAWALGWGAWSRLCLERAANAVPGYALAGLIKQGLERGVGPELVREAAQGTARRLDEMHAEHYAAQERESGRLHRGR